jgi:hypothetical protein
MQQFTRLKVVCYDSLPHLELRKFAKAENWATIGISWWGDVMEPYRIVLLTRKIDEIIRYVSTSWVNQPMIHDESL